MDLGEHSANNSVPVSSSCRKLRKFFNAVLPIVRLQKLMKRLCVDPAAVEISTIPRKLQEKLNPENLKLQFSNNVRGPIYTGLPIGDQEGNPLDLHLIDCSSQNIMNCGAEASAKVEILVLEKDFTRYIGGEKSSLIRGNPQVSLKNGSVSVSHISFKHTRNSLKKRELRLCARVVYPINGIVEAVTKPFFVKDRRSMGKSLKPLILDDQVWKLQTIRKDGPFHNRLMNENIETVQDFLTHYFLNRENLLRILGRHMNVKKLDAAVNQAKSKLELKRYVYRQENLRVVFTDVGELIGVQFCKEGHSFSFQQLVQELKAFAMEMVKIAFQNGSQNFKVLLDDDSFYNGFTSEEAYNYVIDTQQRQPVPNNNVANYMPNTSLTVNNYDNISQINGALPHQFHPDDNDIVSIG
ncbi:hypothetical protein EJD97_017198 [Solanum chilense]|uniref:Uncharacterized protein n=1 Tax=Solanum chilense TaxID=4083 RepID=A0A6N2B4H2_SOLCI|nr:hypothetical protein EJD97_017198 [Solanum chilense]